MNTDQETPRRKTDDEIRARIAEHQVVVDEEELNGGQGNEDWSLAIQAIGELRWVMGE